MQEYLELLGKKAKDKVTGFTGVIENIFFDLYGCIQVGIAPPIGEKGEIAKGAFFDVHRLEIIDHNRVMVPTFGPLATAIPPPPAPAISEGKEHRGSSSLRPGR